MKSMSLIPFIVGLIGYDQCVKESPEIWKYGPEYNFRFNVLVTLELQGPDHIVSSNVSAVIKCRPFSSKPDNINNALRCYMSSAEIDNFETDKSSIPPNITRPEPPGPFEITGFTFDILFGTTKVDEIRIHDSVQDYRMNMYREIVSQLNLLLAFNETNQKQEPFGVRGYESSIIGECDTKFEVSKHVKFTGRKWDSKCKKMRLEINGVNDPSVLLKKTRNVKNCTKQISYVFGSEDPTTKAPFIIPETNTFVSDFLISPQSFESHTIRRGIMTATKKDGQMRKSAVYEEIGLRLVSIEPASTEFNHLATYGVTGVLANDLIKVSKDKDHILV